MNLEILGFGLWALGSGFWVLGSGFWVLGSGFWVLDTRLGSHLFIVRIVRSDKEETQIQKH